MATKEAKTPAYTLKAIYFDPNTDDLKGDAKKHEKDKIVKLSAVQLQHFQRNKAVTLDIPQDIAGV